MACKFCIDNHDYPEEVKDIVYLEKKYSLGYKKTLRKCGNCGAYWAGYVNSTGKGFMDEISADDQKIYLCKNTPLAVFRRKIFLAIIKFLEFMGNYSFPH